MRPSAGNCAVGKKASPLFVEGWGGLLRREQTSGGMRCSLPSCLARTWTSNPRTLSRITHPPPPSRCTVEGIHRNMSRTARTLETIPGGTASWWTAPVIYSQTLPALLPRRGRSLCIHHIHTNICMMHVRMHEDTLLCTYIPPPPSSPRPG